MNHSIIKLTKCKKVQFFQKYVRPTWKSHKTSFYKTNLGVASKCNNNNYDTTMASTTNINFYPCALSYMIFSIHTEYTSLYIFFISNRKIFLFCKKKNEKILYLSFSWTKLFHRFTTKKREAETKIWQFEGKNLFVPPTRTKWRVDRKNLGIFICYFVIIVKNKNKIYIKTIKKSSKKSFLWFFSEKNYWDS